MRVTSPLVLGTNPTGPAFISNQALFSSLALRARDQWEFLYDELKEYLAKHPEVAPR